MGFLSSKELVSFPLAEGTYGFTDMLRWLRISIHAGLQVLQSQFINTGDTFQSRHTIILGLLAAPGSLLPDTIGSLYNRKAFPFPLDVLLLLLLAILLLSDCSLFSISCNLHSPPLLSQSPNPALVQFTFAFCSELFQTPLDIFSYLQ